MNEKRVDDVTCQFIFVRFQYFEQCINFEREK